MLDTKAKSDKGELQTKWLMKRYLGYRLYGTYVVRTVPYNAIDVWGTIIVAIQFTTI